MSPVLAVEIWVAAALLARVVAELIHIALDRRPVMPLERVQSVTERLAAKTIAEVGPGWSGSYIFYGPR